MVKNIVTGQTGTIINPGWSWQTVRYDDGSIVEEPTWKLEGGF